ncbi:MAG TPA: IclR family transcriptional regulator [Roseiflexaceae bacterium]|nr:IclR family transcriptional regulator [Roseiflexaceae bacterium]
MMQHPAGERESGIQSVRRAVALLRALAGDAPALGVSELARRAGLHKSTASRLLATLEREGLVEREPGSDRYRLGFEIARLAGQVTHFGDLRLAARPALLALAEAARETVHLAVRDGDEVINIEQVAGPHLVREANWVGRRTPLHCVANGKALLAFAPPAVLERVLAGPLPAFTPRTVTSPAALRRELALVRERGYAAALGEVEEGLHAVAAPVLGRDELAVAAVSVSGPSYRVTPARLPELGALAREAAGRIAARLGL